MLIHRVGQCSAFCPQRRGTTRTLATTSKTPANPVAVHDSRVTLNASLIPRLINQHVFVAPFENDRFLRQHAMLAGFRVRFPPTRESPTDVSIAAFPLNKPLKPSRTTTGEDSCKLGTKSTSNHERPMRLHLGTRISASVAHKYERFGEHQALQYSAASCPNTAE